MKSSITFVAVSITLATPMFLTPNLARAASVELRNIYANVEVIPEDRADVTVEVRTSDKRLPATRITRSDGNVLIDGELSPLHNCGGIEPGHSVHLPGIGWTPASSALKITLHTPREARIVASGAIIGNVRPAQGLDLRTNAAVNGISPMSAAP